MSSHPNNSNYQPPADLPNAILIFPPLLGLTIICTVISAVILF